jgi:hypothetical protein
LLGRRQAIHKFLHQRSPLRRRDLLTHKLSRSRRRQSRRNFAQSQSRRPLSRAHFRRRRRLNPRHFSFSSFAQVFRFRSKIPRSRLAHSRRILRQPRKSGFSRAELRIRLSLCGRG